MDTPNHLEKGAIRLSDTAKPWHVSKMPYVIIYSSWWFRRCLFSTFTWDDGVEQTGQYVSM